MVNGVFIIVDMGKVYWQDWDIERKGRMQGETDMRFLCETGQSRGPALVFCEHVRSGSNRL